MLKVCLIFRDPKGTGTSIEEIFLDLHNYLKKNSELEVQNFFYNTDLSIMRNILNLRRHKVDVFHITGDIHWITPFLIGLNVVNTIHDIRNYKNYSGIKKFIYGLFWVRIPCFFSKKVTTCSNFTSSDLKKFFGIGDVATIHNPVNSKIQYNEKFFINDKPNILQIGTSPHKNLEGVIYAITELSVKLTIIGKISAKQKKLLNKLKIDFKNIFHVSFQEIIECYVLSDIVCFVSFHEGFGMPVIEANSIGRPIVGSNVCSIPEVAGDAALLVDPNNIDEIRSAINTLIYDNEKWNEYAKKGLENAKRFNIKHISMQYAELYKKIIE